MAEKSIAQSRNGQAKGLVDSFAGINHSHGHSLLAWRTVSRPLALHLFSSATETQQQGDWQPVSAFGSFCTLSLSKIHCEATLVEECISVLGGITLQGASPSLAPWRQLSSLSLEVATMIATIDSERGQY